MELGSIDNHTLLIVVRFVIFLMIFILVIMQYLYRKITGLGYAITGNILLIISNLLLDYVIINNNTYLILILTVLNLLGKTFLIMAIFAFFKSKIRMNLYIILNLLNIVTAYYFVFVDNDLSYRRAFLSLFVFIIFIDGGLFLRKKYNTRCLSSYKVLEYLLYFFSLYYFLRMIYSFTLEINTIYLVDEDVLTSVTVLILILFTILLTFAFSFMTLDTLYDNLKQHSIKDPLTKLYNRRYIQSTLRNLMTEVRRKERTFLIVFLDLDHFKRVNDTYGHNFGDEVLVWFSRLLRNNLREVDIVGRYGGEEFIAILTDTSITDGYQTFERILSKANEFEWKHKGLKVTFSGAIMEVSKVNMHEKILDLIDKVDKKMYQAKTQGRNQILIVNEDE